MQAILEPLIRSPRLKLYVDELTETLRRESEARERFRANMEDDVRAEFINGEVVEQMTNRNKHTAAVRRLERLMSTYVDLHKLGLLNSEHSLTEFSRNDYLPDLCYWKREKASRLTPDQLFFPVPDFICEVLSSSTERYDRGVKFEDYAAHGVGEYWIVDPDARAIEQHLLKDGRYDLVGKCSDGDITSTVITGFTMSVAAAFDDDTNLAALWKLAPQS